MTALELFRSGMDTKEIAHKLSVDLGRDISEALASQMVFEQRSEERSLPIRYYRHGRAA